MIFIYQCKKCKIFAIKYSLIVSRLTATAADAKFYNIHNIYNNVYIFISYILCASKILDDL